MEANVLLAKIVANPTESTWAQAYSTLNLYVVLSFTNSESTEKNIVTLGKELLERIQREYFSLDEKSLENIKKSIIDATSDIEDKSKISLALATISNDTLLLITVSDARVVLKRGEKIGTVAQGTIGTIEAFSGKITGDDIIILETSGFSQKIPVTKLSSLLDHLEVTEIAENLAPIVHNEPQGTEAAIILHYKKFEREVTPSIDISQVQESSSDIPSAASASPLLFLSKIKIPKFSTQLSFKGNGKRKIIIGAIIILILVLFTSFMFEKSRQEQSKREELLNEILTPAQTSFEEATALTALNKGLALDEFTELKDSLINEQNQLKQDTEERKKLDEFIGKVESKIGELSAGSTLVNQKIIFDNTSFVTYRDDQLISVDKSGKINLLDSSGESTKSIDSKNQNPTSIAADENSVYLYGEAGITKSTKSGSTKTIVENPDKTIGIDTFGANLYGLNEDENTVDKYSGSDYSKSAYFTEKVTLTSPMSFSIDGSVWILDAGKIRRFTKGKEVSFTVTGLTKDIGNNAAIFTGIDFSSIYILDTDNNRIISIDKNGEVTNQYSSKDLGSANSFAVDEKNKKIYVVNNKKLYSFDL